MLSGQCFCLFVQDSIFINKKGFRSFEKRTMVEALHVGTVHMLIDILIQNTYATPLVIN